MDYERQLKRLTKRYNKLLSEHEGKETSHYSYWGGFSLGQVAGQIQILESIIDDLEDGILETGTTDLYN